MTRACLSDKGKDKGKKCWRRLTVGLWLPIPFSITPFCVILISIPILPSYLFFFPRTSSPHHIQLLLSFLLLLLLLPSWYTLPPAVAAASSHLTWPAAASAIPKLVSPSCCCCCYSQADISPCRCCCCSPEAADTPLLIFPTCGCSCCSPANISTPADFFSLLLLLLFSWYLLPSLPPPAKLSHNSASQLWYMCQPPQLLTQSAQCYLLLKFELSIYTKEHFSSLFVLVLYCLCRFSAHFRRTGVDGAVVPTWFSLIN